MAERSDNYESVVKMTESKEIKHRLSAIMFSDIVGYTTLMGKDEDQAFDLLRTNRQLHQRLIEKYQGNFLKEMGDGILAEFSSAIDAVECAIEIQKEARENLIRQLRIGIHLGDVTYENNDIFGDGVNIASRLETICDPGGIYISGSVQKAIRARRRVKTISLGDQRLKNVDYPLPTYAIKDESLPLPNLDRLKILSGKWYDHKVFRFLSFLLITLVTAIVIWQVSSRPNPVSDSSIASLVILPFDNYTGNEDLDYFVDGMHASLIGDMGKVSALRVISKTTSTTVKEERKSIPEIASQLNIDAVVEASIACLGDSVCVQVKLVTAYPEEKQLWVQDYYVDRAEILNFYTQVTKEISEEINLVLTPEEEKFLAESRIVNPEAYDYYIKGQFYLDQINKESLEAAAQYFHKAIEEDPNWEAPHAALSNVLGYQMQMGFVSPSIGYDEKILHLEKALELNPNSHYAHYVSAVHYTWAEWDFEKGEAEFKKAIELNPNHTLSNMFYAHLLSIQRKTDEALKFGKKALSLDPLRPFNLGLYGVVEIEAQNCEAGLEYFEKALSIEPGHFFSHGNLGWVYRCLGDYDKWFEMWKHYAWWDESTIAEVEKVYQSEGYEAAIRKIIEVNEKVYHDGGRISLMGQATRYRNVGEYDKAMDYYELTYESKDPNLPYISCAPIFQQMKDNPRYIALLEKMGLPTL